MNVATYIPIAHDDDYWTQDIPLFVVNIPYYHNKPRMVQGRIHMAEERYFGSASEIVPLKNRKGTCIYVNMHPYILEPEMFMTVGMYPKPKQYADQDETIGEVLSTQVKGMRQHRVGNAQAWYYPADKTIVLWECFLDSQVRNIKSLTEDVYMPKLWRTFEQWLYKQFPEATHIATPFNDPIAKTIEEYQSFLRSLGYEPIAQAVFGKKITRKSDTQAELRSETV
jgi:hypothetical protein